MKDEAAAPRLPGGSASAVPNRQNRYERIRAAEFPNFTACDQGLPRPQPPQNATPVCKKRQSTASRLESKSGLPATGWGGSSRGDCRTAFLSQAGMLWTASPNLVQQCPHCSAACVGRVPRFFRCRGLLLEPLSKLTDVIAGSHGRAQKIEHFQATVLIRQAQRRGGVFAVERNFEHTIDSAGVDPALDMMQRRPNRSMAFDQGDHVVTNPTDDRQGGVDVERQSHPFER